MTKTFEERENEREQYEILSSKLKAMKKINKAKVLAVHDLYIQHLMSMMHDERFLHAYSKYIAVKDTGNRSINTVTQKIELEKKADARYSVMIEELPAVLLQQRATTREELNVLQIKNMEARKAEVAEELRVRLEEKRYFDTCEKSIAKSSDYN